MFVRIEVFGHYLEFGQTTEPEPSEREHLPYPMQVYAPDFVGFVPAEGTSARTSGTSDNRPGGNP